MRIRDGMIAMTVSRTSRRNDGRPAFGVQIRLVAVVVAGVLRPILRKDFEGVLTGVLDHSPDTGLVVEVLVIVRIDLVAQVIKDAFH
jgi:hypothetical protein